MGADQEASSERMERIGRIDEEELMEQRRVLIEKLREGAEWVRQASVFVDPANVVRYGQAARKMGSHARVEVKARDDRQILRVRHEGGEWKSWNFTAAAPSPTDADLAGRLIQSVD